VSRGSRTAVLESDAWADEFTQRTSDRTATLDRAEPSPRKQPRYHVVLWDDDEHTFDYVIRMMRSLFGYSDERANQLADDVDRAGRAVCLTTSREHAELKRDQIHAFGRDTLVTSCLGSMSSTIEPSE